MRKALVAVSLLLVAGVASASDITFFLSEQSSVTVVPTPGNPSITAAQLAADGGKLLLWAVTPIWQDPTTDYPNWNGVAFSVVTTGTLASPGVTLYNTSVSPGKTPAYRWDNGQGGNILPNAAGQTIAATAATAKGIGMWPTNDLGADDGITPGEDNKACDVYNPGTGLELGYYLLGEVPMNGVGTLKLCTFTNGGTSAGGWITQVGGNSQTEHVYFGTGDAAVNNRPTTPWPAYSTSELADATITPEPASLVLLALAGLALRRR